VIGAEAGLDLAAWLPPGVDDREAVRLLAAAGIEAIALSTQAMRVLPRGGLLLGFASFTPAQLRAGVATMKRALFPLLRSRSAHRGRDR
jgi:GntR family transcriptional regulator/MocR family aminotransferase